MSKRRVKKRKLKKTVRVILLLAVLLIGSGICLFINPSLLDDIVLKKQKKEVKEVKKPKEDEVKNYKASLIMVGDALIHSNVYLDAKQADGSYDFKPMLQYTKPITSKYDLAYYNQETILGGTELGLSNYPRFNSPQEVGDAFIDSGFNLVSLATNHTMDKNEQGVLNSVAYWKSKKNIVFDGQRESQEERDKVRTYKINGISYAFLSYTTWTNGLETPAGKEYLNNVYSDEKAKNDIEKVRDQVDVVIVAMHWGTEYSFGVSDKQTEIANYLSSLGVDIIIGAHPHVVEPVEFINDNKTLVIYSLGNYISDQEGIERLTGLMMRLDINKTVKGKETTISIDNLKADLLYTSSKYHKQFRVYPYTELNNTILPNYQSYYEKYKSIVLSRYQNIEFTSLKEE